jgi:tellurite resistance protein
MVDADNPPPINLGYSDSKHPGYITSFEYSFEENFTEKGYQEEAEHRVEARSLIIKLGVQVAMADGDFADEEGAIIKEWIEKSLTTYNSDNRKKELKKTYNKAFKDGFAEAKKGTLSISEITEQLNDIASKSQKYEALELCFDVMAADGVADEDELTTIKNISEALNLDYDEIQNMKDLRMITLSTTVDAATNAEAILGIEPDWPNEKIQKHLRKEFTKWNGRINALHEGEERENAQRMLDLIAEARKKYDGES